MAMKLKAVIFDLDDTLLNFGRNVDWKNMRREVVEHYLKRTMPVEVVAEYSSPLLLYARMFEFGKKFMSHEEVLKLQQEVNMIIEKYELQVVEKAAIIPGSIEVLEWVKKEDLKIGIITLQGRKVVQRMMMKYKIRSFADAVYYRESPGRPKPYPDHLLNCVKELGCNTNEVIFIGDHTSDMFAARKAGIYTICIDVYKEVFSKEELRKAGAKQIVDSIFEIPNIINKLM